LPVNNPAEKGMTGTEGSYVGDASANKAIAHNLGTTPKLVVIFRSSDITYALNGLVGYIFQLPAGSSYSVTIPDATSFYVGNAASYTNTANENAITYKFVALG